MSSVWPNAVGLRASIDPWDDGVRWDKLRTLRPSALPLDVDYVRDKVLRVTNGSLEDDHITRLIETAVEAGEAATLRAFMPQTWTLTLDRFPRGEIVLAPPPLIAVTSIAYVDPEGAPQTLNGSPAEYQVVPSGERTKARLLPLVGQRWPATRSQPNAVTVTFDAGYALDESVSPPAVTVPERFLNGVRLMVGELYKLRTLSVQGRISAPSVLDLARFWPKVY